MSLFPTAQISKIVDPNSHKTTEYQVAVISDDVALFEPGSFRTLQKVFRRGFRKMLPSETQSILGAALGVAGPVRITIGWWIQSIDPSRDSRRRRAAANRSREWPYIFPAHRTLGAKKQPEALS